MSTTIVFFLHFNIKKWILKGESHRYNFIMKLLPYSRFLNLTELSEG